MTRLLDARGPVDAAAAADVIGISSRRSTRAAEYKDRVFATSCASTRPAARPTRRAVQRRNQFKAFLDHAYALARRRSRPGTTLGSARG